MRGVHIGLAGSLATETGGEQGYRDGPSGQIYRPVPSRPRPVTVRHGTEIREKVWNLHIFLEISAFSRS